MQPQEESPKTSGLTARQGCFTFIAFQNFVVTSDLKKFCSTIKKLPKTEKYKWRGHFLKSTSSVACSWLPSQQGNGSANTPTAPQQILQGYQLRWGKDPGCTCGAIWEGHAGDTTGQLRKTRCELKPQSHELQCRKAGCQAEASKILKRSQKSPGVSVG